MKIQQNFLTPNKYSRPQIKLNKVNALVIHYVGNPKSTAIANRNYFESLKDKKIYASSHYIVGLDGEIIQCIPENEIAYCSNDRNSDTISIENCHPDAAGKFNDKTYISLIQLTVDLCKRYNLNPLKDIIRHFDVNGKKCPLYYVNNPSAWEQLKNDIDRQLMPIDTSRLHKIMGKAELTKEQFCSWMKKQNVKPLLNCTFDELVDLYYTIGKAEGIRADYALCQAIHETGKFQYGGIVLWIQNNYAGLGATDNTSVGNANTFNSPQNGVTAQIQHLKGYATNEPLKLYCHDIRYKYINPLGCAPYLEWLSIPNNPQGKGWASDKNYFSKIMNIYSSVAKENVMTVEKAIDILVEKKLMNSPAYWLQNYDRVMYLEQLLINVAEELKGA